MGDGASKRDNSGEETTARSGVLVAVDGSESSNRSLLWAAREAKRRGTNLTIVHCYYWPSSGLGAMDAIGFLMDGLAKESADVLTAAETTARNQAPGVEVHVESHLGAPVATIVDLSSRFELTVIGSRGLGGFKGMLLGSVSTGVVSNALSTVVVVRGDEGVDADSNAPVVVGVEDSPSGAAALEVAFQAAQQRGCKLVAVHAWLPPAARVTAEQVDTWAKAAEAALDAQIATVAPYYPSVSVEAVTYRDRPTAALLARAQTAQLLVVGTRGRSEFTGMLMGSTSRAMVHHAPCPVMVVR